MIHYPEPPITEESLKQRNKTLLWQLDREREEKKRYKEESERLKLHLGIGVSARATAAECARLRARNNVLEAALKGEAVAIPPDPGRIEDGKERRGRIGQLENLLAQSQEGRRVVNIKLWSHTIVVGHFGAKKITTKLTKALLADGSAEQKTAAIEEARQEIKALLASRRQTNSPNG